jgi:hypothetical protein
MRWNFTFILLLCIGCKQPTPPVPASPVADPPSGPYLLHLPGVSGESIVDHNLIAGLRQGFGDQGVSVEIQIYDWTENDPGIPALQAYKRNHAEAKKIAEMLTNRFHANPNRTIYLTCHSGGAGLAAWALEELPADVHIDSLLMLAPALSPDYDLSPALSHVQRSADVLWSDQDTGILNLGTRTFGTMDGKFTVSAGYVGFRQPAKADAVQYAKLHQFPYHPAWLKYGHFGDHIGPTETPFARHVLAGLLIHDAMPTAP